MKEYWNKLFKERDKEFSYELCLDKDLKFLKHTKLLDMACGDGRNLDFYMKHNFDVTCIDYSLIAIKKLKIKALKKDYKIDAYVMDINNVKSETLSKSFDTITMIHYFPDIDILDNLIRLLNKDGVIYCTTFINDKLDSDSSKFHIGISSQEIELIKKKYDIIYENQKADPRGPIYTFVLKTGF